VIFQTFDLSGTLDKVGARAEAIKSGRLKDMGSPFKRLEPAERVVMQQMVDEFHARFRNVVKAGRGIDDVTLAVVSDGRVWSGAKAAELGLVDQTGQLPDAIEAARQMAGTPGAGVVLYRRPHGYGGSIYAGGRTPEPRAGNNVAINVTLLPQRAFLPTGFYYLWEPGLN
jgi:protease-4